MAVRRSPQRPPAHLISRAEMARKLGVSRAAVTQACRPGERLAEACGGSDGNSVNVLHAAAQRWLLERGGALEQPERPPAPAARPSSRRAAPEPELEPEPAPARARSPRRRPAPPPDPVELPPIEIDGDEPEEPQSIDSLEAELGDGRRSIDLAQLVEPLTVLTERHGDAKEFEGWIRARKALEEARKAQMLRERLEGRLIARTTVTRMFDHIDAAFRLLLSDAPRSIATRIAPQDAATVATMIRDSMSQHLATCRERLDQSLASDDPMAALAEAAE